MSQDRPTVTETQTSDLQAVADVLRSQERFVVVGHENPDGDALGSLLGATLGLRALGKDAVMYLAGSGPMPAEYRFLDLSEVSRELPADIEDRVLLAVDCANERRIDEGTQAVSRARFVVDVDHHHDNSRFGDVNLVVPDASSTAEVIRDILRELDVDLTPQIAEALYVGLVTDTGRFQYTNTSPKALRLAAELVEAGADIHGIFQHVYETVQFAKLKLLARALDARSVVRGRRARRLVPGARATSQRSAPRSRTPKGSSTACARSKARRWSRSSVSRRARRGRRGASRCARATTRSTSRRSPGSGEGAGIRRPRASRPRSRSSEIIEFLRREFATVHGSADPEGS